MAGETGIASVDRWFALVVRRQRETLAERWLARCAIGHFVPREYADRLGARRKKIRVMVPVLPGYVGLFCPAGVNVFELRDRACEYAPIRGLLGREDGAPLRLKDDWQETLRFRRPEPEPPAVDYGPGDQVAIDWTCFSGVLAECLHLETDEDGRPLRVKVLAPLFNSTREVVIPAHAVRRAA